MASYIMTYNSRFKIYYARAVSRGKPVTTAEIADALADKCTLTDGDILAVLWNLPKVLHGFLKQGKTVHLDRLGYFKFELDCKGTSTLEEFDFESQKETVHVSFRPECEKGSSGRFNRRLVDLSTIEWIDDTDYTALAASVAAAEGSSETSTEEASSEATSTEGTSTEASTGETEDSEA